MKFRIIRAVIVALFVSAPFLNEPQPDHGETQRVALSPKQEIALGMQSARQMAAQFGGSRATRRP